MDKRIGKKKIKAKQNIKNKIKSELQFIFTLFKN